MNETSIRTLKRLETAVKSVITVITHVNLEKLYIVSAIWDTKHQNKFLRCFIMVLITIIIS